MVHRVRAGCHPRIIAVLKEQAGKLFAHQHIIRFAPPLVISKEEIDWAMERITQALDG